MAELHSPAYGAYMERLALLKDLIAREDDDSQAAEKLRCEMDELWLKLSDTERSELSKTIKLVRPSRKRE